MRKFICVLLLLILIVTSSSLSSFAYITLDEYGAKGRGEVPAKYGRLQVFSEMTDGQIFIDGIAYPKNSVKMDKLMPGRYFVQIKRVGYEAVVFSKLVEINGSEQATVVIDSNGNEKLFERNIPKEDSQSTKSLSDNFGTGYRQQSFSSNTHTNQIYLGVQNQVYKENNSYAFQGYNLGLRWFPNDSISPYMGLEYSNTTYHTDYDPTYNVPAYSWPVVNTGFTIGLSNRFQYNPNINLFSCLGINYTMLSWTRTLKNAVTQNVEGQALGYEIVIGSEILNEESRNIGYSLALKYAKHEIPLKGVESQANQQNIEYSSKINLENISFQIGFLF